MSNSPLSSLDDQDATHDRKRIRDLDAPQFLAKYLNYLQEESDASSLKEAPPSNFIVISLAKFDDGYYSTRPSFRLTTPNRISILALGNWEDYMAPPSILEFILTLVMRESVAFVSPSLVGSIHLGTKGCICDFTPSLEEAKFKVLHGYVCQFCRERMARDGLPNLANEILAVLRKEWLGRRSDPSSPAGILSHLKYDLFVTKGLTPRWWEKMFATLREEGPKQALEIVAKIVLAILLFYLAAHGIKTRPE